MPTRVQVCALIWSLDLIQCSCLTQNQAAKVTWAESCENFLQSFILEVGQSTNRWNQGFSSQILELNPIPEGKRGWVWQLLKLLALSRAGGDPSLLDWWTVVQQWLLKCHRGKGTMLALRCVTHSLPGVTYVHSFINDCFIPSALVQMEHATKVTQ